ncbi:MAG: LamG-like jellyroll fold domain-containing protein, partial [Ktedonobacterales bacterium]
GSISVQVAQVKGDTTQDYGLVFRRASKGNYYVFGILSTGKWDFYKGVNNTASNVVDPTVNSAIKTGLNATNTLKVTMSGSHFTFFVNGVQVGTADDTSFTSGLSGVAGGDNIEAVYTAYKVTK